MLELAEGKKSARCAGREGERKNSTVSSFGNRRHEWGGQVLRKKKSPRSSFANEPTNG